jgi:general secretion pathway protein D
MTQRLRKLQHHVRQALFAATLLLPALGFAQQPAPSGLEVYSVQHAEVAVVAGEIETTLANVDPTAEVMVDSNRRRIIVKGGPAAQRIALQMLQNFDRPAAPQPAAAPSFAEQAVEGYQVPASQLDGVATALQREFPTARVAKNPRLGQIVVIGPQQVQTQIADWLNRNVGRGANTQTEANILVGPETRSSIRPVPSTPVPSTPEAAITQNVAIRHISPDRLVQQLSDSMGGRAAVTQAAGGVLSTFEINHAEGSVRLSIDRVNRRVGIAGPESVVKSWVNLVTFLDQSPAMAQELTRMVSLQQSKPSDIRQAMSLLRQAAQIKDGRYSAAIPLGARGEPILRVAAQPGQVPPGQEGGEVPAIPVPGATEGEPDAEEDGDKGLIGDVRIEFIPELGIIVLRGRERDVERVRRIIGQIEETAAIVAPKIEIIYLKHLNGTSATNLIVELYDEVFAPRQGPLSITALDTPNAILLIGGEQAMKVVQDLISRLDQPAPAAMEMKVFRLKNQSATDAEAMVANFFSAQPATGGTGAGEPRPGLGTTARVVADIRTNSLIVQAGPRDLQAVTYFIEKLDKEDGPLPTTELKIFRLQNTLATTLAPVLQSALTGQALTGVQGQAAGTTTAPTSKLVIQRLDVETKQMIDSGVMTDVTISADATVNSLIVRAAPKNIELIAELIRQLDQPAEAESVVKVFQIDNGDATTMTGILQQLFGLQVTAGQGALGTTLNQAFGAGANTGVTAGESSLIPLRIVAETRTNSIIVSGSRGDLGVVEILLLRLDQDNAESRKMVVYKLMNAPALDVANTITTMLTSQRDLIQQQFSQNQFVSPYEQFESQIIVVPELVTNSLIVSATPQFYDQILTIIKELDYRPPSVMVNVMICEVELTDAFDFGVELGLQDSLLFDRGVVLGDPTTLSNLTQGNLLAGQTVSTFNLGRSSASSGYGGMVLSAGNESVNILVRAMQDAGRLQVLSKPSVMALNNQVAFVQVGARVPRITGVTTTPQGGSQNSTTDEDVGILLRIQPRINDDGLVVMIIDVEKSEVGPAATGIPIAVSTNGQVINSPQINTTTAQTTISAYTGQTVVFAGLIQKNRAVTSRRVPLLSDIPVLGRLFRFDAESEARKELLIFMTPHIMHDKTDTDMLNFVESERMSWCLSDVVEMYGDVGFSGGNGLWGPAATSVIYPDPNQAQFAPEGQILQGVSPAMEGQMLAPETYYPTPGANPPNLQAPPAAVPVGPAQSSLGPARGARQLPLPSMMRGPEAPTSASQDQNANGYDPRLVSPVIYRQEQGYRQPQGSQAQTATQRSYENTRR